MDQCKIGSFIAENRKQKNLTQEMLGEKLGVTNKTVSRWETGKYMPDLDTIPDLCNELGITVNELLCGEHLRDDYQQQADENIMGVFAKNKSIRKRKQWGDSLTGAGIGLIISTVYAPDNEKKNICFAVGLALLCLGLFIRIKVDREVIGR